MSIIAGPGGMLIKRMRLLSAPSDAEILNSSCSADRPPAGISFSRERAGRAVEKWLALDPANTRNEGPLMRSQLAHDLSTLYESRRYNRICPLPQRSAAEIVAFGGTGVIAPALVFSRSEETFLEIMAAYRTALGQETSFRSVDVGTLTDRSGGSVIYPSPIFIKIQLRRIFAFASRFHRLNPRFCALYLYVALLNLHPFQDGNGRTARLIYNWMIDTECDRAYYCPLYECGELSTGGMLIRVREADYFGRWEPLASMFAHIDSAFGN